MEQKTLNRSSDFKLPTAILGADLSRDGNHLVAGCMDGVYRIDLGAKSFRRIGEHRSYVSSAAYLPALEQLVSAGYDGVLKWFSLSDNAVVREAKLHDFWSWDMSVSPDQKWIASVTGQYLAGDYKYTPAAETEPSLRVVDAATGEVIYSLPHVPSVQAVCFSHDSQFVAAGNLMGEVRVWNVSSGEQVATFQTTELTSWGIIKSHCYLGGVFAMRFTPDDSAILICGMGDMRDPMAGNGKQMWQKWQWRADPQKLAQTKDGQSGEGLMESLAIHPAGEYFAMGGRLRGGDWNAALFQLVDGERIGTIKSGYRITDMMFHPNGQQLILVGGQGQPDKEKDGKFPDFGRVEVYDIT